MKIIGLVGGISWVSTIDYYRYINIAVNDKFGGLNYAECIIYSLNYAEVIKHNTSQDFEGTYKLMLNAATQLKNSGVALIILCANTMHMFADRLQNEINLPVIHIAVATANAIKEKQLGKVGLLGTKFTMELDFFKDKLKKQNIETIIPNEEDRAFIHTTIFDELGKGIILEETKQRYRAIIEKLIDNGAEGIIAGCTEIPLIIKQEDISVPLFDTTYIHSIAAVQYAMK